MYPSGQSQSVDGGLPSKTPVSLLQELCMRRGISPKYDLLQIEGPVHEPTFVYRVTVGEYAANGSGQTKKKAKHAAAKTVLDIIIQGGSGSTGQSGAPELSSQIVSPYDDGIPGNPVGSLQELCMSRRWPPPTYELTAEEGFPHERTFSICCTIGNHKEIGAGKSKKLSKRQAANKMLLKLKDQPADHPPMNVLADDDDEVNKESASVSPAAEGSCPKACTKASFSIVHPKRVCSHLSDVFLTSSYQVCEKCFKFVYEIGRQGLRSSLDTSLPQDNSLNLNGTSKVSFFNDENENLVLKRASSSNEINYCNYSNAELGKLEEMFDKLIAKHAEEVLKEKQEFKMENREGDSVTLTDPFKTKDADENRLQEIHDFQRYVANTDSEMDGSINCGIQLATLESAESSLKTISTPRLVKGILHNFNFDDDKTLSDSVTNLYPSDQ